MAWSIKDLENLKSKGLGVDGVKSPAAANIKPKKAKLPKPEPKGLIFMKNYLRMLKVVFETEHRFHEVRMFRFDIAIPEMMLAIEYEGLMSEKSGHTTVNGYVSDCEKYNLAQLDGWTVLRYTAKNYEDFPNDFEIIKENDKNRLFN